MPDTVLTGSLTVADGTGGVTPPAGSVLEIGCQDHPAVSIDLEGAFTGTVVIEAAGEDAPAVDWFTPVVLNAVNAAASASLTVAARRFINAAGLARVRLRCTAFSSGPMTATLRAGQGLVSAGGGGGGGAVTVVDGGDVTQGTTTDAGIVTDIAGTGIGFLRGAIKQWITYLSRFPAALGSTTAANSLPVTLSTDGQFTTSTGSLTETAPATDTASSGLNGRLQRVAQRLTSLIALLPTALISNRLDVNLGAAPATVTIASPTVVQGAQNGAGTASWNVQGAGAAGAAVAGNPVLPGVSDGTNVQNLKQGAASSATQGSVGFAGVVPLMFHAASDLRCFTTGAFTSDGGSMSGALAVQQYAHNGGSTGVGADRVRNNLDAALLTSAARTTTQTSANITTYNAGAIKVVVDTTVLPGAAISNVVTINEVDAASGKSILLLTGLAIVGVSTNEYVVDPAVPAVANVSAQKRCPRVINVVITAGNGNSATYSVGYMLLPV